MSEPCKRSKFVLGKRSRLNLTGVHPDLILVVSRAIELTEVDFVITEGMRTIERQRQLVAAGASQTLNSRHLTGHAIDFAAWVGEVRWDTPLFQLIGKAFLAAAKELGIAIVWGGQWKSFKDFPHVELDRRKYPA